MFWNQNYYHMDKEHIYFYITYRRKAQEDPKKIDFVVPKKKL